VKTVDLLSQLLGGELISIADVGAADGLAKRWRPIAPVLRIMAFEPARRRGECRQGGAVPHAQAALLVAPAPEPGGRGPLPRRRPL
jgi:hypothetical protein